MIFHITVPDQREPIGTAMVEPYGDDYSVVFYLNPGFALSRGIRNDLEKRMKQLAREMESGE